ncbi:MAG: hypothetical protein KQA33_03125 [Candidatus Aenigmarchaeota archaeon]|nr:hypothetical protein [Candidatus Aenigmarchaeota archaeon]
MPGRPETVAEKTMEEVLKIKKYQQFLEGHVAVMSSSNPKLRYSNNNSKQPSHSKNSYNPMYA